MPGYRGFPSRKAYEDHYSDPAKYADELPAMKLYALEAENERLRARIRELERELDAIQMPTQF